MAEQACATVTDALLGSTPRADDVCLLAVRPARGPDAAGAAGLGRVHPPPGFGRATIAGLNSGPPIPQPNVQAQLSVRGGRAAVEFYQAVFGAVEVFRFGGTDGHDEVVAQLAVGNGLFWVEDESPPHWNSSPQTVGGATARMLLIAEDPQAVLGTGPWPPGPRRSARFSGSTAGSWAGSTTRPATGGRSPGRSAPGCPAESGRPAARTLPSCPPPEQVPVRAQREWAIATHPALACEVAVELGTMP